MKVFRTLVAFFLTLLPLILFVLISILLFVQIRSPWNLILGVLFLVIGLFSSMAIFNLMRRRGVIDILSAINSSYDLDDLEPVEESGVSQHQPEELKSLFEHNNLAFNKGTISVWGDWEGRKLNEIHHLAEIDLDEEAQVLTLKFTDSALLKIKRPQIILGTSTYLKIVKAKEVLWKVPDNRGDFAQFSYLNTGKSVKTRSNTKWKPHRYDIGIGKNAVYLQG